MADRLIVVGVDGTTTGLRAVAWAAKEALLRGDGPSIPAVRPTASEWVDSAAGE